MQIYHQKFNNEVFSVSLKELLLVQEFMELSKEKDYQMSSKEQAAIN